MATVRNSRGFRKYGEIGVRNKKTSNAALRREREPARPSPIAKDPLQVRPFRDVRESSVSSRPVLQKVRAGKRNGPKIG